MVMIKYIHELAISSRLGLDDLQSKILELGS